MGGRRGFLYSPTPPLARAFPALLSLLCGSLTSLSSRDYSPQASQGPPPASSFFLSSDRVQSLVLKRARPSNDRHNYERSPLDDNMRFKLAQAMVGLASSRAAKSIVVVVVGLAVEQPRNARSCLSWVEHCSWSKPSLLLPFTRFAFALIGYPLGTWPTR